MSLAPREMMSCAGCHEQRSHRVGHGPGDREARPAPSRRVGRLLDHVQAARIHERKAGEVEQHVATLALQAPQHALNLGRAGDVKLTDQSDANAPIGLVMLGKGEVRVFTHCAHRGTLVSWAPYSQS